MLRILSFFFLAAINHAAEAILVYLDSSPESKKLQAFLSKEKAPDNTYFSFITLPTTLNVEDKKSVEIVNQAIAKEVTILPCIVFSNSKNSTFSQISGTPKLQTKEQRSLFLKLIQDQYNSTQKLSQSKGRSDAEDTAKLLLLLQSIKEKGITTQILQTLRHHWSDPSFNTENLQFIGLKLLYPALMSEYARLYQRDHSPESEKLFLEAIATLERVRDLDPTTPLGSQAHEARESLRKARLQAAPYDS